MARNPLSLQEQRGPFGLLSQFNADMSRLFDEFMGGRAWASLGATAWMPEIEMRRRDGRLLVCVDLPGLRKDDVSVEVDEGRLTIQGERRQASEEGEADSPHYRSERSYGSFYRVIGLPPDVDLESAQAQFHDGVLEIGFACEDEQQRQGRRLHIEDGEQGQHRREARPPSGGDASHG